jgi:hypothetical protein
MHHNKLETNPSESGDEIETETKLVGYFWTKTLKSKPNNPWAKSEWCTNSFRIPNHKLTKTFKVGFTNSKCYSLAMQVICPWPLRHGSLMLLEVEGHQDAIIT